MVVPLDSEEVPLTRVVVPQSGELIIGAALCPPETVTTALCDGHLLVALFLAATTYTSSHELKVPAEKEIVQFPVLFIVVVDPIWEPFKYKYKLTPLFSAIFPARFPFTVTVELVIDVKIDGTLVDPVKPTQNQVGVDSHCPGS